MENLKEYIRYEIISFKNECYKHKFYKKELMQYYILNYVIPNKAIKIRNFWNRHNKYLILKLDHYENIINKKLEDLVR